MRITHGLTIDKKSINLILNGEKQWEMRARETRFRGWFALMNQGQIYGVARLVDCSEKLNHQQMQDFYIHHKIPKSAMHKNDYKCYTAWKLEEIHCFQQPINHSLDNGILIWTNLDQKTSAEIEKHFSTAKTIRPKKIKTMLLSAALFIKKYMVALYENRFRRFGKLHKNIGFFAKN